MSSSTSPRWKVNLYTVWFVQILSLGGFGFGFPFLPFYMQELGVEDPEAIKLWTGVLASLPGFALALMSPVWGLVADRIGKKWMMIRALSAAVIVIMGMGLAQNVWHLAVLRLLQGLFTGTVTAATTLVASGTPDKRLTSSLGFLGSSNFIGLTIGPAIGGLLAESFGYRMSFFLGAGVLIIGLLLVIFVVREPEHASDPEETSGTGAGVGFWKGMTNLVTHLTPAIGFLLLILFITRIGRSMLPPFLPLYIQELHGKKEGVAAIVGMLSASGAFAAALSGILAGRLAERLDPMKLVAAFSLGAILFASLLITITDILTFGVVFACSVFAVGGIQPVVTALMIRRIPAQKRGVFIGLQTMVASMAWMLAPVLGSVISLYFGYRAVIAARPVFDGLVLGLVVYLLIRKREQMKS